MAPTRELPWKTALVTGASSGLGRELAAWLARRGVVVYGAARRVEEIEAQARAVSGAGASAPAAGGAETKGDGAAQLAVAGRGRIEAVRLDVADPEAVLKTVRELDAAAGGLDLVVANAGVAFETAGESQAWEPVSATIDVNVRGAVATLVAAAPGMVARRRGQLVGMSSMAAARGMPRYAAYSASKAFLTTYLESLRGDLKPHGVAVTAVHPGYVRTPGTARNQFPMPFLMDADVAVDRLGRGLVQGGAEVNFPWPMAAATSLLRWLPNGLWDWAARRFGPKPGSR